MLAISIPSVKLHFKSYCHITSGQRVHFANGKEDTRSYPFTCTRHSLDVSLISKASSKVDDCTFNWSIEISVCFIITNNTQTHDDVIKWKHFPRHWPFVRGIHRSPVNSPHKGQWRGALTFSLICVWINGWVNNRDAGDLRRYHAHYDVIVMYCSFYVVITVHFLQTVPSITNRYRLHVTVAIWDVCLKRILHSNVTKYHLAITYCSDFLFRNYAKKIVVLCANFLNNFSQEICVLDVYDFELFEIMKRFRPISYIATAPVLCPGLSRQHRGPLLLACFNFNPSMDK